MLCSVLVARTEEPYVLFCTPRIVSVVRSRVFCSVLLCVSGKEPCVVFCAPRIVSVVRSRVFCSVLLALCQW